MTIAAIQTEYDGHRFRSRLEARWAVFFNHLDIAWQYEPEGYRIPDGRGAYRQYLPDFYLPGHDLWVEVKGDNRRADWAMWRQAVNTAQRPMVVLGEVPRDDRSLWLHPLIHWNPAGLYWAWHLHDGRYGHGYCSAPGEPVRPMLDVAGKASAIDPDPRVVEAYRAARMARFEHGEAPTAAPALRPTRPVVDAGLSPEQRYALLMLSIAVGSKVRHPRFGVGTVVALALEAGEATADFGVEGRKRLLLRYAPIEVLSA